MSIPTSPGGALTAFRVEKQEKQSYCAYACLSNAARLLGLDCQRSQDELRDHFKRYLIDPGEGIDLLEVTLGLGDLWSSVSASYHLDEPNRRRRLSNVAVQAPALQEYLSRDLATQIEAIERASACGSALPSEYSDPTSCKDLERLDAAKQRGLCVQSAFDENALFVRLQAGSVALIALPPGLQIAGHGVAAAWLGGEPVVLDPRWCDPIPWSHHRAVWLEYDRETLLLSARDPSTARGAS
jgi:hypothetical protein